MSKRFSTLSTIKSQTKIFRQLISYLLQERNHFKAQEWMKSTTQSCTVNVVLFGTVEFAAAYTVPGGLNQDTGSPILLNQTFFLLFTVTDFLSLASTLAAVVLFLSILTSAFPFQDFKNSLTKILMYGACTWHSP